VTKIYDALERASRNNRREQHGSDVYPQLKTLGRLDKTLIELYDGIVKLVRETGGNAVEFIGPVLTRGPRSFFAAWPR